MVSSSATGADTAVCSHAYVHRSRDTRPDTRHLLSLLLWRLIAKQRTLLLPWFQETKTIYRIDTIIHTILTGIFCKIQFKWTVIFLILKMSFTYFCGRGESFNAFACLEWDGRECTVRVLLTKNHHHNNLWFYSNTLQITFKN